MEIEEYISFLLGSTEGISCVKAGEIVEVSHDRVTRLLSNNHFTGKDLFEHALKSLSLSGGWLTIDDSVIDKPYSSLSANDLVGRHYSGKHHRVVQGINLVLLIYTDRTGRYLPINFRVFDQAGQSSKHDLLQTMVREVLDWGLKPVGLTADSWYSSLSNLKFLKNWELGFMVGLKKNRVVSPSKGEYLQVSQLNIPEQGQIVHLKGFGFVKVFRTVDSNGDVRHYAMYNYGDQSRQNTEKEIFMNVKRVHWKVEESFRQLKQYCSLERFYVRKEVSVKNHIFCALRGLQRLLNLVHHQIIESVSAIKKIIYREALKQFILEFA